MQKSFTQELILTIVVSTILLFSSGIVIVYYFFFQQRKKFQHEQEVIALREAFYQIILKSKLEIQEVTLDHIAKELHANFSHLVSLININLSVALANSSEGQQQHLIEAKQLAKQLMSDIKILSISLNTDHIMKTGFLKAFELELNRLERTGRYKVTNTIFGPAFRLPPDKEIVLFRLCQEILNNIVRHAKATEIDAVLDFREEEFKILIADNGIGFDINVAKEKSIEKASTGLMNIAGRAEIVNASLNIDSCIGKGTTIEIVIPTH